MEGTYPLPEAQLDRFLLQLNVGFPDEAELVQILQRTTQAAEEQPVRVFDAARVIAMRELLRAIPVPPSLMKYVVRVLKATHPQDPGAPELIRRYVRYGASPRGAQAMLMAARVLGVLDDRYCPSVDDVRAVAPSVLRHRIILNFEGEAEGIDIEDCLAQLLARVPVDVGP
jgi:MoxR-like ATPase